MSGETETPLADEALLAEMEAKFSDEMDSTFAFEPLTLADRCDADSAEAAVAQVLVNGEVLKFCGHHWRQNSDVLSQHPHSVPEEDSKPMTWGRAAELGPPAQRDAGSIGN